MAETKVEYLSDPIRDISNILKYLLLYLGRTYKSTNILNIGYSTKLN